MTGRFMIQRDYRGDNLHVSSDMHPLRPGDVFFRREPNGNIQKLDHVKIDEGFTVHMLDKLDETQEYNIEHILKEEAL